MANTEELESKPKEQEEMNHREKEEIDRLRYELTINTKLVEHLQKATKPVYIEKRNFRNLAVYIRKILIR